MKIGIVYKISCVDDEKYPECYIGSTILTLKRRFQAHKDEYKKWKLGLVKKTCSYDLFEKFGIENCKITPIQTYKIIDTRHLNAYEQLWINKIKPNNKQASFRITPISRKNDRLIQLQKNPKFDSDNYKKQLKKNPNFNRERVQKFKQKKPNYFREHNKKYSQIVIICECGVQIKKCKKSRHVKTEKHQTLMKKQNN